MLAGWLAAARELRSWELCCKLLVWREREREEPCHRPHLTCLPAPAYIGCYLHCFTTATTTVTPPPSHPSPPPPPPSLDTSLLPSVPSAETERPATTRARATSQGLNHRPRGPPLLLLLLLSSLLLTSPLHHPQPHHRANWTRRCLASRPFATAGTQPTLLLTRAVSVERARLSSSTSLLDFTLDVACIVLPRTRGTYHDLAV